MPRGRRWNVSSPRIRCHAEEDHLQYGLGLGLQRRLGWSRLGHDYGRCSQQVVVAAFFCRLQIPVETFLAKKHYVVESARARGLCMRVCYVWLWSTLVGTMQLHSSYRFLNTLYPRLLVGTKNHHVPS